MKRCLVTGGAGFIGSNLTRRLVLDGCPVTVIDNLLTGRKENLAGVENEIDFVKGDICDLELIRRLFAGVEVVFHQAALPSVPRSIRDPLASNAHNIDGTLNVLVAARDAGVRRVVLAASSSAYGDTAVLPKVEDMPGNPLSPYAITKYAGELYARVFTRVFGLETVSLRYFNVFGPRQDPDSHYAAVIPKFIRAMMQGKNPVIFGDGGQSRDFTYVNNIVAANLLAANAEGVAGEIFNVGCGRRHTLKQLVACLNHLLGTAIEPVFMPSRPGEVLHSQASIKKAEKFLGYRPVVSLEEGLHKTVEWFKHQT